jgi:hypothetical protein
VARVPRGEQLLESLQDLYGEAFNPVLRMSELAIHAHNQAVASGDMGDMATAVQNWDRVASYIQPKLKAVEGQVTHNIRAAVIDMTGLNLEFEEAESDLLEALPDD